MRLINEASALANAEQRGIKNSVLTMLSKGHSIDFVAENLDVSIDTVREWAQK